MVTQKIKCPKCKTSFIPIIKESKPTALYHYTSFEVLTKLFNEKGELDDKKALHFWFSNPLQTNDKNELHFYNEDLFNGVRGKEIEKEINRMKNEIGTPFTLSLVHQKKEISNEIPLWKMYGDNFKGVRLKFNFKELQLNFNDRETKLIQCVYLNKTQMNEEIRQIKKTQRTELEEMYKKSVIYKTKEWAYENEWRIVLWNKEIDDEGYRNDGRLYLSVKIPLSCLDVIEIGPKADQEAIEGSLNLIKAKLGDIEENKFKIQKSALQIGYI